MTSVILKNAHLKTFSVEFTANIPYKTAANIAKYDVWSSLVIFKNHNPLEFNLKEFSDYIYITFQWFDKVLNEDRDYKFPFLYGIAFPRAGASQIHGHAQILMTKDRSYAKVESLKRVSEVYHKKTRSELH